MYMMIRTQVLFPEDLLKAIRELAIARKTSVSHILRTFAVDSLPRKKKKIPAAKAMLLMAKHAYKGKVPKDFSTNDEYLYGKYGPK